MNQKKYCKNCGCELIVNVNWYKCHAKANHVICIKCVNEKRRGLYTKNTTIDTTHYHSTNSSGIVGKVCSHCKYWLPLDDYNKCSSHKDGLQGTCKYCKQILRKEEYENNTEKILEQRKLSYQKHKKAKQLYAIDYNKTLRCRYLRYRREATKRDYDFLLDFDEFCNLVSQPCYYCDEIDLPYNGIDRIDNSKGYELDNCVPCCIFCNRMKSKHSKSVFLNKCKLITEKMMDMERD